MFLAGVTDGSLPINQAINGSDEDVEEERRLFYVGITRAREVLHISWHCPARRVGGRPGAAPFLIGLVPDDSPASRIAEPTKPGRRPRCRVCGKQLIGKTPSLLGRCEDCPSDLDEELLVALKEWRRTQAPSRSAGVRRLSPTTP